MAIEFARMEYMQRAKGQNACAMWAYRAGDSITCERTGQRWDYSGKLDVLYSEVLLPEGVDPTFADSRFLWNAVEWCEKRKDSQLGRELILALPRDPMITDDMRLSLARDFIQAHFVSQGVIADLNIHTDKGNPHAHVMITQRRVHGAEWDRKKATDLEPKVKGSAHTVQKNIDTLWGKRWAAFQNEWFLKQELTLTVDPTGLISQVHLGPEVTHHPHPEQLALHQENERRKQAAQTWAQKAPDAILHKLSLNKVTFTEWDIAKLISKTTDTQAAFTRLWIQVMASKELLGLGQDDNHQRRYTTQTMFEAECDLLGAAYRLKQRAKHGVSDAQITHVIEPFKLNAEQTQAARHVLAQGDLKLLRGFAGTGKSYTLGAMKTAWEHAGYRVLGTALAAKAADSLEKTSGIQSTHIHSLRYQLDKHTLTLDKHTILVVDEAGMIDLPMLSELLHLARQNGCKLVLTGDPAQFQPIGAGAPFKALVETVGAATLSTVRRQHTPWQQEATWELAQNKTADALRRYGEAGHIQAYDSTTEAVSQLVQHYLTEKNPEERPNVYTHLNKDIKTLNHLIQQARIEAGEIKPGLELKTATGKERFSTGDRILFTKNDRRLGLRNGKMGTLLKVYRHIVTVAVDGEAQSITFDPEAYPHMTLGYALTVYKAQGETVNKALVYVGAFGWDRYTTYVALSRHQTRVDLFYSESDYRSPERFIQALSAKPVPDTVLAQPRAFSLRRNMTPDLSLDDLKQLLKHTKAELQNSWQAERSLAAPTFAPGRLLPNHTPKTVVPVAGSSQQAPKTKATPSQNLEPIATSTQAVEPATMSQATEPPAVPRTPPRPRVDVAAVKQAAQCEAAHVVKQLLGKPHHQNGHHLRYGSKGSFSIAISGPKQGFWYDFETGDKGDMIALVQRELQLPFIEAVRETAARIGCDPEKAPPLTPEPPHSLSDTPSVAEAEAEAIALAAKKQKAQTLVNASQLIAGTLAERYLREHRGITLDTLPESLRFLPSAFEPNTQQSLPALLAVATNYVGEVTAVQVTFLDPQTAHKAAHLAVPKRTYGHMKGAFVSLSNQNSATLAVAEGIETALTIAQAQPDWQVHAALGVHNFKHVVAAPKQQVIICADNDGNKLPAFKSTYDAAQALSETHAVSIAEPSEIGSDFNDLLQSSNTEAVAEQLETVKSLKQFGYDRMKHIDKALRETLRGKKATERLPIHQARLKLLVAYGRPGMVEVCQSHIDELTDLLTPFGASRDRSNTQEPSRGSADMDWL